MQPACLEVAQQQLQEDRLREHHHVMQQLPGASQEESAAVHSPHRPPQHALHGTRGRPRRVGYLRPRHATPCKPAQVCNQGAWPCQQPGGKAMPATRGQGHVSNQGAWPCQQPGGKASGSASGSLSWCPPVRPGTRQLVSPAGLPTPSTPAAPTQLPASALPRPPTHLRAGARGTGSGAEVPHKLIGHHSRLIL